MKGASREGGLKPSEGEGGFERLEGGLKGVSRGLEGGFKGASPSEGFKGASLPKVKGASKGLEGGLKRLQRGLKGA